MFEPVALTGRIVVQVRIVSQDWCDIARRVEDG